MFRVSGELGAHVTFPESSLQEGLLGDMATQAYP